MKLFCDDYITISSIAAKNLKMVAFVALQTIDATNLPGRHVMVDLEKHRKVSSLKVFPPVCLLWPTKNRLQ